MAVVGERGMGGLGGKGEGLTTCEYVDLWEVIARTMKEN